MKYFIPILVVNTCLLLSGQARSIKNFDRIDASKSIKSSREKDAVPGENSSKKRNPIEGSWKIIEIQYLYTDTTYKVPSPYEGRLIVTKSSYSIIYNPYGAKRKSAEVLSKLSDEEIKYAFQTIVFNSGSYMIDGDDFITTADLAKVPGFEGGVQHYRMNFTGDETSLTMHDETYPSGEKPEWFGKLEVKFILERERR